MTFFATCECKSVHLEQSNVMREWASIACKQCNNKLKVYTKDKKEIIDYNEKKEITYTAKCDCGDICINNNSIAHRWKTYECNKCNSYLKVYLDKLMIRDFNNRSCTLGKYVAKCDCENLTNYKDVDVYAWKYEKCNECHSKLKVWSNNLLIHDYNNNGNEIIINIQKNNIKKIPIARLPKYTKYEYEEKKKLFSKLRCHFCDNIFTFASNLKSHLVTRKCCESKTYINNYLGARILNANMTEIDNQIDFQKRKTNGSSRYSSLEIQELLLIKGELSEYYRQQESSEYNQNTKKQKIDGPQLSISYFGHIPYKFNDVFMGYQDDNLENNELLHHVIERKLNFF